MEAIVGTWEKRTESQCSERYPDTLELSPERGVRGEQREGARFHPIWDVGGFEVTGNDVMTVSLSNGGRATYRFSVSGDVLAFEDQDGCRFEYTRASEEAVE